MTRKISDRHIELLLSRNRDAIKRMRRCLHNEKHPTTKAGVVTAWHTYSLTLMATRSAEKADTLAWAALPDDDIALSKILKQHWIAKTTWHYYATYFACYVIIGLLLAGTSQFLLYDEAIKRVSSQLTSPAIGATFYPAADAPGKNPKIAVFAVDDQDLAFFGKTYPLSYAFHAQMLDAIGTLSPKAVFIDIWFHDERDDASIGQLVNAICRLHHEGTRVYLATLASRNGSGLNLRPELRAIATPAIGAHSLEQKTGACAVEVAVSKEVDAVDRQTWRYDLTSGAPNERIFSAAAQIYNDLPGHAPLPLSASPLALIWGVKGAEINRRPPGFGPTEDNGCRNTWSGVEIIPMSPALRQKMFPPEATKPFCAYHPTLPFSALRKMPGEMLQPLITDQLIIYGSNLQSMNDVLYSPVHGRLAGVHMHAMALDNLLHFGNTYPVAEEFGEDATSAGTIFPFTVVCVLALFATLFQWRHDTCPDNPFYIRYCLHRFRIKINRCWRAGRDTVACWLAKCGPSSGRNVLRIVLAYASAISSQCASAFSYLGLPTLLGWIWSLAWGIAIAIVMLFLMAWIGLRYFHLGPLSWMEYAISPIAMHFLHIGKKVAHYIHPKLIDLCIGVQAFLQSPLRPRHSSQKITIDTKKGKS